MSTRGNCMWLCCLQDVEFSKNQNSNGTGGLYVRSAERIVFKRASFIDNSGENGGAVTLDSSGVKADFDNCLFEKNFASNIGGAINQNLSAILTITNTKFLHNEAIQGGGALHIKVWYRGEFQPFCTASSVAVILDRMTVT